MGHSGSLLVCRRVGRLAWGLAGLPTRGAPVAGVFVGRAAIVELKDAVAGAGSELRSCFESGVRAIRIVR